MKTALYLASVLAQILPLRVLSMRPVLARAVLMPSQLLQPHRHQRQHHQWSSLQAPALSVAAELVLVPVPVTAALQMARQTSHLRHCY